jgi:uncharacterized protein YndB with AHSA1/START domain
MKALAFLLTALVAAGGALMLVDGKAPAPSSTVKKTERDPAMAELSRLVGGIWVNDNPKFVIENRYEWGFGGTAIRGIGIVGKGSPHESQNESILGWDPVGKSVFYLDCHGGNTVYNGTVSKGESGLVFEFATVVGPPSKWREEARFTDADTLEFTIYGEKEGKWSPVHSEVLKRTSGETGPGKIVTEGVIDAPVDLVWAALCTGEGLKSWNVAHADVDLKVGGLMRTHYDPKGHIGDPNTIENTILSFEPNRMISIRVTNPPATFPFKNAIKSVWQVIHFEPIGPAQTRLRITGMGYGEDEESRKLRAFFDKGNAFTLKKLQGKFAARPATSPPANPG